MSASTKKVDAKLLKVGHRFKLPAHFVTIVDVKPLDTPSLDKNLLVFTITGSEGPFKNTKAVFIAYTGDKVEKQLNHPWPRRLYDWIKKALWTGQK